MKKLFAILLTVAMMATMSMTAFAATNTDGTWGEGDDGNVEITYGVSQSYTVVIPADITLSADAPSTMEVSASNVVIPYGNQLTVSISSANEWYLVDTADSNNKLAYSVKNGETAVANNDAVLTVAAGDTDGDTVSLTTTLVDSATVAGTYKDTLTFTVSVAPVLTFTIDGTGVNDDYVKTFTMDEGMTWREWVASEYNTDGWGISNSSSVGDSVATVMLDISGADTTMWITTESGESYYRVQADAVITAGTTYYLY